MPSLFKHFDNEVPVDNAAASLYSPDEGNSVAQIDVSDVEDGAEEAKDPLDDSSKSLLQFIAAFLAAISSLKGANADLTKGDTPGHEFHGNQYTASGASTGKTSEGKDLADHLVASHSGKARISYPFVPKGNANLARFHAAIHNGEYKGIFSAKHEHRVQKDVTTSTGATATMPTTGLQDYNLGPGRSAGQKKPKKKKYPPKTTPRRTDFMPETSKRRGAPQPGHHDGGDNFNDEVGAEGSTDGKKKKKLHHKARAGNPSAFDPEGTKHSSIQHHLDQERQVGGLFGLHKSKQQINGHSPSCPCLGCR